MSTKDDTQQQIGKLLPDGAQRDAIHIAVAPVVASEPLTPGCFAKLTKHALAVPCAYDEALGVVDPFLTCSTVKAGERFYLFLLPNTITSLRHEWAHPAFGQEGRVFLPAGASESEAWIRAYAGSIVLDYSDLMAGADAWIKYGDYLVMGGLLEGESVPDEFWPHYENVRGTSVPDEHKHSFFSCSC